MSDIALSLKNISKSFKRFQHPGWRALDALGFSVSSKRYDVFMALRDINLEVKRGEKVALIGRNGAGKSTLLRLISNQVKPTKGLIQVNGELQTLMELGTGFHPDFTGIENIRSTLSYQGIQGKAAQKLIEEIIEFTELEDFIARPVREFSAGMYARLAFATATTITPDILIIDEILGAGDAYFVGKSIQRMKQLTTQGATILFVSHDMSATQMLCDRGVWIDKGTIQADGDILAVSKAYLSSIREDEELKIRLKSDKLNTSKNNKSETNLSNTNPTNTINNHISLFRFITDNYTAPNDPLTIHSIQYGQDKQVLGDVSINSLDSTSRCIVEQGITNWSHVLVIDDTDCRTFGNFGGKFIHAPFQIDWAFSTEKNRWIEIRYKPSSSHSIALEQFDETTKEYERLALLSLHDNNLSWQTLRLKLDTRTMNESIDETDHSVALQVLSTHDRYGKGPVKITAFGFLDRDEIRRHTLISGEFASACISYSATSLIHDPVAVIAIYRPDGSCAMQVLSNRQGLQLGRILGPGHIVVTFDPLFLGPGEYMVSVALFKELDLVSKFEPEAYDLHDRCYPLTVLHPEGLAVDIGTVNQPSNWTLI
jgi:lipopolysaccharide transport system ATP-binding protein